MQGHTKYRQEPTKTDKNPQKPSRSREIPTKTDRKRQEPVQKGIPTKSLKKWTNTAKKTKSKNNKHRHYRGKVRIISQVIIYSKDHATI